MNNESESVGCVVGAVVQLKPSCSDIQYRQLLAREGVEVHAQDDQRRLVVTIEADNNGDAIGIIEDIRNMSGVLNLYTVYHHLAESQGREEGWSWR